MQKWLKFRLHFKLLKITTLVLELKKSKENSTLSEASWANLSAAKEY